MDAISTIAYLNRDGSILSIYSQYDGNTESTGRILQEYYTGLGKINRLLHKGSIIVLKEDPDDIMSLSDIPENDPEAHKMKTFPNMLEWMQKMRDMDCEFLYLYIWNEKTKTGQWICLANVSTITQEIDACCDGVRTG